MLIVEQNVRQVLKIADRAYLLEVGRMKASGSAAGARRERRDPQGLYGDLMDCQLDIFFLEAILNGLLLAGLLALLALGLNLIFGVIDVVWICYAELVMVGMYGIYYAYKGGTPFLLAALFGIVLIALAGVVLHHLVIRPVLDSAPINQLLVTGGVLFVLQAAATMAFGIDFKNLGIRLGSLQRRSTCRSRIRASSRSASRSARCSLLWLFLQRTYIGIAIRAIAQDRQIMPLMGVDQRRIYLVTSAIGGGLAGLAAALMVLQFDIYPQIGLQFGPLIFMICVLGGLGNMIGGFIAAFIIAEFIAVGGSCFATEWGYAIAFLFFMVVIFIRPQGLFGGKSCDAHLADRADRRAAAAAVAARGAFRVSGGGEILSAPADPDPDLVVHLHRLVADGPLRPHLARPRRVHRHRRLRDGAAVELRRDHAVDRHSGRGRGRRSWSRCWSAIRASTCASSGTISRC